MSKRVYAFFDMDHTLTRVDTGFKFLCWWARRHPLSSWRLVVAPFWLLGWKLGLIRLKRVKEFLFSVVKGVYAEALAQESRVFVNEIFDRVVKAEALETLAELKKTHQAVLASASPEFYVRYFAERFGIESWIATRYQVNNGRYTGRMLGEDCRDAEKVRRLAEIIPLDAYNSKDSIAFSDNVVADGPLLSLAGQQFRVHPKKWVFIPWGGVKPRRPGPDFD